MHGVLQQDTQESLKCLNKHIPHQLKKKKKELVQQKDKHSLPTLSNGQACPSAFLEPGTALTLPFSLMGPEPLPLSAD